MSEQQSRPFDQDAAASKDPTARFLEAIAREAKQLKVAAAELDGLWGKGIRHGGVDRKVLDKLRGRSSGIQTQIKGLERLAKGELE
jgi:hypothetical protein